MKNIIIIFIFFIFIFISCNTQKIIANIHFNYPNYKQTTLIYKINEEKIKTIVVNTTKKSTIDSINNIELQKILNKKNYNKIIINEIY